MNDKSGATMSSTSHPRHRIPHVTVAILIALLALALAPGSTFAGSSPIANLGPRTIEQAAEAQPPTVTIPAGSAVEVTAFGHCMDRGEPYPGATLIPVGLAPDNVRVAIGYSVAQGYTQDDVWQPQLAVWTLMDGQQPSSSNRIAREIVEYASSGQNPADVGLSTPSVVDAINDGALDATVVNFASVSNPDYFGAGTLVLTNLTDEDQEVHIPYGIRFIDPNSDDNQDIAVFPGGSQPGLEGPQGPAGPMGSQGPAGADGEDGATGPMGPAGPAGADGQDGATGPMGATVPAGPLGPQGPAGADGEDGATGPMGSTGPAGTDGAAGPMGPQGPAGVPGISCWDMNMNGVADNDEDINGDGVHDTWDCEGEDGPVGPTGPTGATGPAGADGEDGATGPMGATGPAGTDGAIGPMGPQGSAGADGEDGATGPMGSTGPAGADGEDGATGPAGADGATGPMGPAGADGATGPMGTTGPVGPMGPAGPAGLQGSPGLVGVTMVMDMTPMDSEPTKEIEAVCPAGTLLISGGANVEGPTSED